MRSSCIAPIILCLALVPAAAAENLLAPALESLARPTMAGNAQSVDAVDFRFGNTVFTIQGEVEGVLGADETVGFAFKGKGKLAIAIPDGPFKQANLTSIDDDIGGKGVTGGVFGREFEGGVFFTNKVPEGLFSGEHVTSSRLADIVDQSVERIGQTRYTGLDHMLAQFILDDVSEPVVAAVLWKGSDDSLYLYDPVNQHDVATNVL